MSPDPGLHRSFSDRSVQNLGWQFIPTSAGSRRSPRIPISSSGRLKKVVVPCCPPDEGGPWVSARGEGSSRGLVEFIIPFRNWLRNRTDLEMRNFGFRKKMSQPAGARGNWRCSSFFFSQLERSVRCISRGFTWHTDDNTDLKRNRSVGRFGDCFENACDDQQKTHRPPWVPAPWEPRGVCFSVSVGALLRIASWKERQGQGARLAQGVGPGPIVWFSPTATGKGTVAWVRLEVARWSLPRADLEACKLVLEAKNLAMAAALAISSSAGGDHLVMIGRVGAVRYVPSNSLTTYIFSSRPSRPSGF